MNLSATSKSEERFFKKIKKMKPDQGHIYTLKQLCNTTCRGCLKVTIDGTLDCPMCGISKQERIDAGRYHGLHNSHVGLGFDAMVDNVLTNFLMTHDYTQYTYQESVSCVKLEFIKLHKKALDSKRCAIQISCSRCNPKIEKCTVEEIEMWKLLGTEAWKKAKYPCSPNRTNSCLDIRHYCVQHDSNSESEPVVVYSSLDDEVSSDESVDDIQGLAAPRRPFNDNSSVRSSDEDSSDSDVSKRPCDDSEDESPPNKRSRRSCVGHPDYSHDGQHLRPVADTQKPESDAEPNWKHWFETYCTKTECGNNCKEKEHKGCKRGNQVQMRKKAKNSWLNYCIDYNLPEKDCLARIRTADFDAKLKAEMGDLYHESKGTRSVKYYDHLVFKSCDNSNCK